MEKQEIKDIIRQELAELKSDLLQVKHRIEEKFGISLSTIDNDYIERKYVKYCGKFWLQETTDYLQKLTKGKNRTAIQEIFNSLDRIQRINQIPKYFNELKYYTILVNHLVREEDEIIFTKLFKEKCLEEIVAYIDSAKKELYLLDAFVKFLNFSKSLQTVIEELKLKLFCNGDLSFDMVIKNIMDLDVNIYGENLKYLQEATEGLIEEKDFFLVNKFKEVLGAYIKPVEIKEILIDARLVVEVTGKNIVVSEILNLIENKFPGKNIAEVRFVGGDIIHIDACLKNNIWHGKNIVILTKTIKVYDKVTWDISGKDSSDIFSDNAGTEEDGCGKQGKDGFPGESGGNVLILGDKIENPENLTIISNGGNGSHGQDGGDGKNGEDGVEISKEDFDTNYPPVAACFDKRMYKIDKVIKSIYRDSSSVETVWCTNKSTTIRGIIESIDHLLDYAELASNVDDDVAPSYDLVFVDFKDSIFIEATTRHGNKIIFSFESGGFFTACQAFFLYKGATGQPGKAGGEYGLGGQGGYAGEITVKNPENGERFYITTKVSPGKNGGIGLGGLYGKPGKNGSDRGYLDYSVWGSPVFCYGKYKVEYYNRNESDRIWCPYKDKYAGITAAGNEHHQNQQYEERRNTRSTNERQRHAQAERKKNISSNSILTNYSHQLISTEKSTLQSLSIDLDSTESRTLQAINIASQEQQEKNKPEELRTWRHSSYPH